MPTCFGATAVGERSVVPSALGQYPLEMAVSPFETGAPPFKTYEFITTTPATTVEQPQEDHDSQLPEPFGQKTSALIKGGLQSKWSAVKNRLRRESKILKRCRVDTRACPPAAQRFLAIVDKALTQDGWARIAEINRAINLDIKPVDDMTQYGAVDLWATPLMTFASNAGDCEDYAIAKYAALQQVGITDDNLRLVIVHLRGTNEDHAVAAVRHDGHWLILDNRTLNIRQDADIAEFKPLFVANSEGIWHITAAAPVPPQKTYATKGFVAAKQQYSYSWPIAQLPL